VDDLEGTELTPEEKQAERALKADLDAVAAVLHRLLPPGWVFALMVYQDPPGAVAMMSSSEPAALVVALRQVLQKTTTH
jgi:hypothetical protein